MRSEICNSLRSGELRSDITVSDLEIMSNANNYSGWIYRRILPFIGQRILEVGAGIGNFTRLLLNRELIVAVDKHPACVDYLKARLGNSRTLVPMELDISDPAVCELSPYEFDTVICLNVLEHVEDDLSALAHMYSVLRAGGILILLVPAFQFLYGSVDRSLGHYRRYNRKSLIPKVRQAGFEVERVFYMNMIGMAGWLLNNRILGWREESARQIGFFDRFVAPWAESLERLIQPPVGLSLISVCRKK